MPKANTHPADLSVIVADGHVLVFQGFFHQALFILREHVPRFIDNPQQAAMLVIPPFAATALSCYTALEECTSISLNRDSSLGASFNLVITTSRGSKMAYYADHEVPLTPRTLARQGIGLAITPMAVTTLDQSGSSPSLSLVVGIQQPQVPDYSMRFAADPQLIKEAVRDALCKTKPTQRHAS